MAGSNDFTGQNIQDTYQRVLQLSSSGQIADGTGSLVSLLPTTASNAGLFKVPIPSPIILVRAITYSLCVWTVT